MSIEACYNEQVTINRLEAPVGDSGKRGFEEHLTAVDCEIQPLESSISRDISVGFGKDYLMICAVIDIEEGDRVIRADGSEWRITGLEKFDDDNIADDDKHLEISIRAFQS